MFQDKTILPARDDDWIPLLKEGDLVWLVKEIDYATVVSRFKPDCYRGFGDIKIERSSVKSVHEIWLVDKTGRGFDGNVLIRPVASSSPPIAKNRNLEKEIDIMKIKIEKLENQLTAHLEGTEYIEQ